MYKIFFSDASYTLNTDEVLVGDNLETMFRSLFFCTKKMKENFYNFPDIVFLDSTYGLSSSDFIVTILAVMDAHGLTHVVGIGILINETEETLTDMMEAFKHHHSKTMKQKEIKVFMTDKDFTERKVLRDLFPSSKLLLCQFHVFQIFQRTFTKSKMNISEKTRKKLLECLKNMSNSSSEFVYNINYIKFCKIASPEAKQYFRDNWENIKTEWVKAYMAKSSFYNFTNNRLESINKQLKKIFVKPRRPFCELIDKLFEYLKSSLIAKDYKYHVNTCKKRANLSNEQTEIYDLLTPFSARYVWAEFYRHERMTIKKKNGVVLIQCNGEDLEVTETTCTCIFYKAWTLPCRHIFHIRRKKKLPVFTSDLCPTLWYNKPIPSCVKGQENDQCISSTIENAMLMLNFKKQISRLEEKAESCSSRILKIIVEDLTKLNSNWLDVNAQDENNNSFNQ